MEPGTKYQAIAAGKNHTVALTSRGSVLAWGGSDGGQTEVPAAETGYLLEGAPTLDSAWTAVAGTLAAEEGRLTLRVQTDPVVGFIGSTGRDIFGPFEPPNIEGKRARSVQRSMFGVQCLSLSSRRNRRRVPIPPQIASWLPALAFLILHPARHAYAAIRQTLPPLPIAVGA